MTGDIRRFSRLVLIGCALAPLAACATAGPTIGMRVSGAPQTRPARTLPQSSGLDAPEKVGKPYEIAGRWYTPASQPDYDERGMASWYGAAFDGHPTANGETFDMNSLSAAHKTLPLPCLVEVTNLDNGKSAVLRVNDRGPFVGDRLIDLSRGAAQELDMDRAGLAHVRVRYVGPAPAVTPTQIAEASGAPRRREDPKREPAGSKPERDDRPLPPPAVLPPPQPEYAQVDFGDAPSPPPPQSVFARYSVDVDPPAQFMQVVQLSPTGTWAVQAATYADLGQAEQAARKLTRTGAPLIKLVRQNGQSVYAVMITAPSQNAAAAMQGQVAARGFPTAQVLRP